MTTGSREELKSLLIAGPLNEHTKKAAWDIIIQQPELRHGPMNESFVTKETEVLRQALDDISQFSEPHRNPYLMFIYHRLTTGEIFSVLEMDPNERLSAHRNVEMLIADIKPRESEPAD